MTDRHYHNTSLRRLEIGGRENLGLREREIKWSLALNEIWERGV